MPEPMLCVDVRKFEKDIELSGVVKAIMPKWYKALSARKIPKSLSTHDPKKCMVSEAWRGHDWSSCQECSDYYGWMDKWYYMGCMEYLRNEANNFAIHFVAKHQKGVEALA